MAGSAADFVDVLPEELTFEVLSYLSDVALSHVCCVAGRWRRLGEDPLLWRRLACKRFGWIRRDLAEACDESHFLREYVGSSWKLMYRAACTGGTLFVSGELEGLAPARRCGECRALEGLQGLLVADVACGFEHALAVTSGNSAVYALGRNVTGQLGFGSTCTPPGPMVVQNFRGWLAGCPRVISIAVGGRHSLLVTECCKLFSWGCNKSGQLGLGDCMSRSFPTEVVRPSGSGRSPTRTNGKFSAVAAGADFTVAVGGQGRGLYAWGANASRQLGLGNQRPTASPAAVRSLRGVRIAHVRCGIDYVVCLAEDGSVYSWGANRFGALGLGEGPGRAEPAWMEALQGRGVRQLGGGGRHTLAVSVTGEIYAWGLNRMGQLGVQSCSFANRPVLVPPFGVSLRAVYALGGLGDHSIVFVDDGRVFGFGFNAQAQIHPVVDVRRPGPTALPYFAGASRGTAVIAGAAGARCTMFVVRNE